MANIYGLLVCADSKCVIMFNSHKYSEGGIFIPFYTGRKSTGSQVSFCNVTKLVHDKARIETQAVCPQSPCDSKLCFIVVNEKV